MLDKRDEDLLTFNLCIPLTKFVGGIPQKQPFDLISVSIPDLMVLVLVVIVVSAHDL